MRAADRRRGARVIARPLVGRPGQFRRPYNRRDFSMLPPSPTLCDVLTAAKIPVIGVGKIADIFAGRGVPESLHSEGNVDGMSMSIETLQRMERGLLFVNLVDFDMVSGHRNDGPGLGGHRGAVVAGRPLAGPPLGAHGGGSRRRAHPPRRGAPALQVVRRGGACASASPASLPSAVAFEDRGLGQA